ncbi:MAG TPA: type 1 glutamine amidotransferase [Anaerolineae bacterium]|nr:type 1 glutamine amidotransferase [Anaerolineae bacterium]
MRDIKVMLWQARVEGDPTREEERESFAEVAGINVEQVTTVDMLTMVPTLAEVQAYDALLVGGSGDYYVSKRNLPTLDLVSERLRELVAVGQPTFASCFGFQLLAHALGSEIIHDPEGVEVGTFDLTLTDEGAEDELFGYLPKKFTGQLGRKDRALVLPEGTIHLASSERAPFQALRVVGKPIWGTQFHPELTKETNLARFDRYIKGYAAMMSREEIEATRSRFTDSYEANELVARFLRLLD